MLARTWRVPRRRRGADRRRGATRRRRRWRRSSTTRWAGSLLDHLLITAADRARPPRAAKAASPPTSPTTAASPGSTWCRPTGCSRPRPSTRSTTLRRRLDDYLGDADWLHARAVGHRGQRRVGRHPRLTQADQRQSWFLVPLGVYLVLLVALRDPWACLNLVATMLLTYAFALGATHLVFVTSSGRRGSTGRSPTSCSCCWWPWASITTSS